MQNYTHKLRYGKDRHVVINVSITEKMTHDMSFYGSMGALRTQLEEVFNDLDIFFQNQYLSIDDDEF